MQIIDHNSSYINYIDNSIIYDINIYLKTDKDPLNYDMPILLFILKIIWFIGCLIMFFYLYRLYKRDYNYLNKTQCMIIFTLMFNVLYLLSNIISDIDNTLFYSNKKTYKLKYFCDYFVIIFDLIAVYCKSVIYFSFWNYSLLISKGIFSINKYFSLFNTILIIGFISSYIVVDSILLFTIYLFKIKKIKLSIIYIVFLVKQLVNIVSNIICFLIVFKSSNFFLKLNLISIKKSENNNIYLYILKNYNICKRNVYNCLLFVIFNSMTNLFNIVCGFELRIESLFSSIFIIVIGLLIKPSYILNLYSNVHFEINNPYLVYKAEIKNNLIDKFCCYLSNNNYYNFSNNINNNSNILAVLNPIDIKLLDNMNIYDNLSENNIKNTNEYIIFGNVSLGRIELIIN